MSHPLHLAPLLLLLAGCASFGDAFSDPELPLSDVDRLNAQAYLDKARRELDSDQVERAIHRLAALRDVDNLTPEMRLQSEALLDEAAHLALERAEGSDETLETLAYLWELDLTPRMRARAGVRYGERLMESGDRVGAYKQIQAVEEELPNHSERARAGAVLTRVGLDLIRDSRRYRLILRYRTKGMAALEFLVLTYPLDPGCAEAYSALAIAYEARGKLELAVARHEDLIQYHPSSPQRISSEAAIPRLRLDRIDSIDHDRGEAITALNECVDWLARNPGHPLKSAMSATETRCRTFLTENDLYLSRYYRRIGNDFGARMHAERGMEEALRSSDEGLVSEAAALLDALPPAIEAVGEAAGA